jgi:hypothetical protein
MGVGRMKGVLAAIAGKAEFRQAQHANALLARRLNGPADIGGIVPPIEWRLVHHRRSDMD